MNSVKIDWLKKFNRSISQIYSSGLEYTLVNDQLQQCHDFVYCKDFIQDAIHGFLYGHKAQIFGFWYDPGTQPPLSFDKLRIMVTNTADKDMRDKIPNVVDFIGQFCKKMKLKRTVAYEVANPPKAYAKCGVYLLEGSGMWLNAPVLVSMYLLLLRVGFVHKRGGDCMQTVDDLINGKVKPYQANDHSQMSSARKGIEDILKHGYRKRFFIDTKKNYPVGVNIGTMHNCSGIVAFAQGTTKQICKYWTRDLTKSGKAKIEEIAVNKADLGADK